MNIRTIKTFAMTAIFAAPLFAGAAVADGDGHYVSIVDEENLEGTPTDAQVPILIYARKHAGKAADIVDAENLEGTPTDNEAPIAVHVATAKPQQYTGLNDAWNLEGTPTDAEAPLLVYARNQADTEVAKAAGTTQVSLKQ